MARISTTAHHRQVQIPRGEADPGSKWKLRWQSQRPLRSGISSFDPTSQDLFKTVTRACLKRSSASSLLPLRAQGTTHDSRCSCIRPTRTPFSADRTADAWTSRESQSSPAESILRIAATCPSIRASRESRSARTSGGRFAAVDSGRPSTFLFLVVFIAGLQPHPREGDAVFYTNCVIGLQMTRNLLSRSALA